MFSDDQPIVRPDQDLYRRANFALTLARSIDDLKSAKRGFVFAITGAWGSGKSSVLHLIERYLLHIDMSTKSEIPLWWQNESDHQTIEALENSSLLFEKVQPEIIKLQASDKFLISASLEYQRSVFERTLGSTSEATRGLQYWHLRELSKTDPKNIVIHFSPWLIAGRAELASALLSEIARATGKHLGKPVAEAFGKLLQRLSEFAPVAGAGLNLAAPGYGAVLNALSKTSSAIGKRLSTGSTLDEVRGQLQEALLDLEGKKIVVIVDDIDRLTPGEAAETVAIVKSLGDLPNVVYLLTYDRLAVSKLVSAALQVDGQRYLEKIVQHEIELPPIEADDMLRAVDANIRAIFSDVYLDPKRLRYLWHEVLRKYVRTPRDARRYFNPLALAQSGLAGFTDPIDLMTLQAIHIFEPATYQFVRDNISKLAR